MASKKNHKKNSKQLNLSSKAKYIIGFDWINLNGLNALVNRNRNTEEARQFKKEDISKLRYGVLHSRFGYPDGVSIVMEQIERVLVKNLKVSRNNIFYLVGQSKNKNRRIIEKNVFVDGDSGGLVNSLIKEKFNMGLGGGSSETVENAINEAKKVITDFVEKKKIDVIIAHNSSHALNLVYAVALSRYYRDCIQKGKKTPKYILWWHDSHLERKHFENPSADINNYLLQGVPGPFVEYIVFINSLQFKQASRYFKRLDKRSPGFYNLMELNHDTVYNTTDVFINKFKDLQEEELSNRVEKFIEDFKIRDLLKKKHQSLNDMLFVLQHTRLVNRKRIDFALAYCYELLSLLKKKGKYKSLYFFVSGHSADKTRKKLVLLNRKLRKEYNIKNLFLVFGEDYYDKTDITFEEYPKIFAKLGGISTYFSEVEGFGNNLLEVLASGLVPIIYTYPVFKSDIAKYGFKTIALDKFNIDMDKLEETVEVISNKTLRRKWVDYNLKVLKKHFAHETMALKLVQAITSKRGHK